MYKVSKLSLRERLVKEVENEKSGKYCPQEHPSEVLVKKLRFRNGYRRFYVQKSGRNI
jgi:hypothetical protein